MSTEESRTIALRFVDAAGSGDVATIVALLADDATWWVSKPFGERIARAAGVVYPASGVVNGRDAILTEFVGPTQALFVAGSPRLRVDDIVAEGDKVVVLMHADAEVAAGGEYHNDFSVFFEIRDGQIVTVHEYLDTFYAIATLASGSERLDAS